METNFSMETFRNESNNVFVDISSEAYRSYKFPGGDVIRIDNPEKLSVSAGGHRLFDGVKSHYIPKGWIHLEWQAKKGKPHFVK